MNTPSVFLWGRKDTLPSQKNSLLLWMSIVPQKYWAVLLLIALISLMGGSPPVRIYVFMFLACLAASCCCWSVFAVMMPQMQHKPISHRKMYRKLHFSRIIYEFKSFILFGWLCIFKCVLHDVMDLYFYDYYVSWKETLTVICIVL